MADQTTVYDVVTNFRITDNASQPTDKIINTTQRLNRETKNATLGLGMLTRQLGAAYLGWQAFRIGQRVVAGLNEQMNRTIQVASQFNLAFKFDADPAKQFAASMRESRKLVGEIIKDARELPGESKDFFGVLALISGPAFRARAGAKGARRMTSEIALSAPFAGVSPQVAGYEAMEMLQGRANARNPLFAMLHSGGLLPNAAIFNAMSLTERFKEMDSSMTKVTGNPFFREQVIGTLDTQLSNLRDLLFGPQGAFGLTFSGPTKDFIQTLKEANEAISTKMPAIVGGLRLLTDSISVLWQAVSYLPMKAGGALGITEKFFENYGTASRTAPAHALLLGRQPFPGEQRGVSRFLEEKFAITQRQPGFFSPDQFGDMVTRASRMAASTAKRLHVLPGALPEAMQMSYLSKSLAAVMNESMHKKEAPLNTPSDTVHNTFHIHIDLKSDTSPEAIALQFQKAMAKLSYAPMRASRGLPLLNARP